MLTCANSSQHTVNLHSTPSAVSSVQNTSSQSQHNQLSVAQWANTLSEPQYLLGLAGWRPAGAWDQIRVAA